MFSRAPFWSSVGERLSKFWGQSPKDAAAASSLVAARAQPDAVEEVHMSIENGSLLAIGTVFPTFRFQPQWSFLHRTAVGRVAEVDGSRLRVIFPKGEHRSPPMAWNTCFISALWPLMIPAFPPGISIDIESQELQGWIDLETGSVEFNFDSTFSPAVSFSKQGPALKVACKMSSGEQIGRVFHAVGERIRPLDGRAKLVCISDVPPTPDPWQNRFLGLPTDALSLLNAQFTFVTRAKAAAQPNGTGAATAATAAAAAAAAPSTNKPPVPAPSPAS